MDVDNEANPRSLHISAWEETLRRCARCKYEKYGVPGRLHVGIRKSPSHDSVVSVAAVRNDPKPGNQTRPIGGADRCCYD